MPLPEAFENGLGGGAGAQTAPPRPEAPDGAAHRVVVAESPSCAECKRQAPIIDEVARRHPGVVLERLDARVDPERLRNLGVMATPTVIGYVDGREVARLVGRRGPDELAALFAAVAAGSSPVAGSVNTRLWLGTGLLLSALGLLTGPAWPLVGFGAGATGYGAVRALTSRTR